ncbi:MAG: hypothetical protein AB3X41_01985 [Leptothrix ochracea]|uniref:hypothetical protein n=1 Tax=Leptothrix ochracea TaxID=735331 RepID=UPI0034E27DC9
MDRTKIGLMLLVLWLWVPWSWAQPLPDTLSPSGVPLHLIPMYGDPDLKKSQRLLDADARFIAAVESSGTRHQGSRGFSAQGWQRLQAGEADVAMRRFNQAWLLDPDDYIPYWGFGALLSARHDFLAAIEHYQKALVLLSASGDLSEKHRLLTDAARAYALQGFEEKEKDPGLAKAHIDQAHAMFSEAIQRVPTYGNAYRTWAVVLYVEGDFARSWQMVKTLRQLGESEPPAAFIEALSTKMTEPAPTSDH